MSGTLAASLALDHARLEPPLQVVCGLAFEAKILARRGIVALWGLDAERLEAALEAALRRGCRGVVSVGTAGGLAPGLPAGTWVVAEGVAGPRERLACDPAWVERIARQLAGARLGLIASVATPVASAAGKAALHRETGALAVDMESHRAAHLAHSHGVPFVACRVIVDDAARTLPSSALVGLREDGGVALGPIIAELARHPGQIIDLWRLAGDAATARRSLARGLDALGPHFAR